MYRESESEKESVIAKLGVLEDERKKLIEEITSAERKLKETSRVSCYVANSVLILILFYRPPPQDSFPCYVLKGKYNMWLHYAPYSLAWGSLADLHAPY